MGNDDLPLEFWVTCFEKRHCPDVTLCISQVNVPLRNGPTRAANVQRRRVDDVPAKSLFHAFVWCICRTSMLFDVVR